MVTSILQVLGNSNLMIRVSFTNTDFDSAETLFSSENYLCVFPSNTD